MAAGKCAAATCPRCDGAGTDEDDEGTGGHDPEGRQDRLSSADIRARVGPASAADRNGDVYLVIKVVPHPRFERVGDDLVETVKVPLYTAILGGEVVVPTIDGQVALTIPAGTQTGKSVPPARQGHAESSGRPQAKRAISWSGRKS